MPGRDWLRAGADSELALGGHGGHRPRLPMARPGVARIAGGSVVRAPDAVHRILAPDFDGLRLADYHNFVRHRPQASPGKRRADDLWNRMQLYQFPAYLSWLANETNAAQAGSGVTGKLVMPYVFNYNCPYSCAFCTESLERTKLVHATVDDVIAECRAAAAGLVRGWGAEMRPLLAGRAALGLGSGRVYCGLLAHEALAVDPVAPELMLRHPDEALGLELDAFVVGPGLGQGGRAETLVAAAIASDLPCVLDADALNLIAEDERLRRACTRRSAETLLTPHPAEAGRLLVTRTEQVQADRLAAARNLSANFNAHVVLKGNGSVIVARDGRFFVNTSGNAGMASAGMGDVLSGVLGALLAQGLPGEAALVLGAHLHGCAADALVAAGRGPVGLRAGELIEPARRIWNGWLAGSRPRSGS